jgi:eukaryotic-like serine/threonine-protein kinase
LKVIAPELVEDGRVREWFLREVLAATHLSHPNIAMAYDANELDGVLFMAMECVEGPTLDQLVRKQGPLPVGLACAMLHQLGRALQHAHEKGMVHRDIKPANLMIPQASAASVLTGAGVIPAGPTPLVKIVDFGLARLHTSSAKTLKLHKEGAFFGTPDYVSPEQARDLHAADIRSDLYSLGCTFYHALTGARPFHGANAMETVIQHIEKEPDAIETYRPEVPPGLASVIRRLMAKRPAQRFQTPADMVAELGFLFAAAPLNGSVPMLASASAIASSAAALQASHAPIVTHQPSCAPSIVDAADMPPEKRTAATEAPELVHTTFLPPVDAGSPRLNAAPAEESVEEPVPGPVPGGDSPSAAGPLASTATPPKRRHDSEISKGDVFVELWRRWTGVIDAILRGGKPHLSESDYRALHAQLLESCRTQVDVNGVPGELLDRAAQLAAPWLSLQTLAATDAETLSSLCQRCQQVGAQLGVSNGTVHVAVWAAGVLALVGGAILFWLLGAGRATPRDWSTIQNVTRLLMASPWLGLFLVVPLAAASMYLFARFFRS